MIAMRATGLPTSLSRGLFNPVSKIGVTVVELSVIYWNNGREFFGW